MPKLKKETVELLEKVKAKILKHPKQIDMSDWIRQMTPEYIKEHGLQDNVPECGTVACIGGWATVIKQPGVLQELVDYVEQPGSGGIVTAGDEQQSAEVLGLNKAQADRLFFVGSWPGNFVESYIKANTPEKRAAATAARIDRFIATNGRE